MNHDGNKFRHKDAMGAPKILISVNADRLNARQKDKSLIAMGLESTTCFHLCPNSNKEWVKQRPIGRADMYQFNKPDISSIDLDVAVVAVGGMAIKQNIFLIVIRVSMPQTIDHNVDQNTSPMPLSGLYTSWLSFW
jgi:hypothetical protein